MMQIIIKGKQAEITPQLRQYVERKVQKLSRLVDQDARVEVTVTEEQTRSNRDRYAVHLALVGNAHPIHSEVSAINIHAALDTVLAKVVTQLGRQKDRHTTAKRHGHASKLKVLALSRSGQLSATEDEFLEEELVMSAVEEGDNEVIWSRVMEIRRLPTRPMNDREVIAHMEKDGMSFYPFFNEETQSVNVMYKLEQGGYGLLVPAID